jgi:predicted unusual protein kinase regulating ubiquinone biosynthesis (AarF/ABC1/UbiB family)
MSDRPSHFRLRDRLARVARLGGMSARTSAGWLASALLDGAGRSEPAARLRRAAAERAAESLGRLKGLAMKAGQMLSFVSEEVPEELRQALSYLQTSSEPRPFQEIAATITFGVVNGDPNPGNYLFDRAGARVTFLEAERTWAAGRPTGPVP